MTRPDVYAVIVIVEDVSHYLTKSHIVQIDTTSGKNTSPCQVTILNREIGPSVTDIDAMT